MYPLPPGCPPPPARSLALCPDEIYPSIQHPCIPPQNNLHPCTPFMHKYTRSHTIIQCYMLYIYSHTVYGYIVYLIHPPTGRAHDEAAVLRQRLAGPDDRRLPSLGKVGTG